MAKLPAIDGLTVAELKNLADTINKTIADKKAEELAKLKAEMRRLASEAGFSIDELFFAKRGAGRKSGADRPVMYRNPDNPDQTWSGRGRRPAWFATAMKRKGATPVQLAA